MVKLPDYGNHTAAAIYARYAREAEDWRREHLGASMIGTECMRALWLSFRWATTKREDGRMLRLLERGQREEEWLVEELRALGWVVHDRDPETGEQWRVRFFGGHFGGSCDGVLLGVIEAPKAWHLFEAKTSNKRRFDELLRGGVQVAQPRHYAQMQVYMHGLGLKRALYVVVCKDDDRIHTERVHYDAEAAAEQLRKAETVIRSAVPLERIHDDPAWWQCRLCDHHETCQLQVVERIARNCRTCVSATPMSDGTWRCELLDKTLDLQAQRDGCGSHLLIPGLLPWQPVNANEDQRWITYEAPDGRRITDSKCRLSGQ